MNTDEFRRFGHHLIDWLALHGPDVMCLQETKCDDAAFPSAELAAAERSLLGR